VAYRIPVPRWIRILRQLAAIEEDLSIVVTDLRVKKQSHDGRGLDDPIQANQALRGANGEAVARRPIPFQSGEPPLEQGLRRRLEDGFVLNVLNYVD
jgi:hypothetical protein